MMKPGLYNDQKCSQLLGKDENDSVLQLLGPKCQSLSMAVVQFFSTDGPEGTEWRQKNFGILSFVKDPNRKSYYFRLYCPIRHQLLWEHEMYNGLHYQTPAKFFHCFEAEECIVGFNYASEEEATMFEETIVNLQRRRREKRLEQRSKLQNNQNNVSQTSVPNSSYGPPLQINGKIHKNKGKTSKNKKYTKDQIGLPENFRHVQHIGWDPDRGFDLGQIKDPQLNKFFAKAGVSESQLRNPQTRDFIYDFIDKHGGMDAIKEAVQDSPVPPPLPTRFRQAPPPPPLTSNIPPVRSPAPPPPRQNNVTIPVKKQDDFFIPPPPPPLMNVTAPPPPPPQIELSKINKPVETVPDTRSALLEAIRSGTTLKHVNTSNPVKDSNSTLPSSRSNLLDQIRQGVELKSVQPIQKKSVNNLEGDGLAGALARALADRARVIHSDSSTSDSSEDDDDDWDD
ncbi:CRIB domain,PH domain-like,WASP family, EVH1 domain,WH1/EVH1 domain,WH2 domain,Wiscott-Aldrich syndrome [Cinara cedri]|uniref:CRIB domain,PH domain-like,WASP family, EVH1 domain,WH1/EVH1 domain,WH2 domain,Wiscott-Aldrich syndrome n=1 Tax=Cinara cedri TaxID=506608 RepID=A0A5E4NQL1_9HEMI|nr:CRIB domain,PH domain-like,WASP family, EVH1 domain,WH1/EVH1 domain,WH2 domain,Wiscott-Aldrich syndrome [Cinara cedri]